MSLKTPGTHGVPHRLHRKEAPWNLPLRLQGAEGAHLLQEGIHGFRHSKLDAFGHFMPNGRHRFKASQRSDRRVIGAQGEVVVESGVEWLTCESKIAFGGPILSIPIDLKMTEKLTELSLSGK